MNDLDPGTPHTRPDLFPPPTERQQEYAAGGSRYFGWDSDGYKVTRYSPMGGMKPVATWPLTEEGWASAWSDLGTTYEKLAAAVADRAAVEGTRAEAAAKAKQAAERFVSPPTAAEEQITPGESPGSKVCPMCAEEVKVAAVICRFCGHEFSRAQGAPPPPGAVSPALPIQTSGIAVIAFVCSIVGLWIVGLPLGLSAQKEIDASGGRLTGRRFATAGVVLGVIGIFVTIIVVFVLANAANNGPTYA